MRYLILVLFLMGCGGVESATPPDATFDTKVCESPSIPTNGSQSLSFDDCLGETCSVDFSLTDNPLDNCVNLSFRDLTLTIKPDLLGFCMDSRVLFDLDGPFRTLALCHCIYLQNLPLSDYRLDVTPGSLLNQITFSYRECQNGI